MFLVWFETKKPANQNHGLLKPNQTKSWFNAGFGFGLKPVKPRPTVRTMVSSL
jgi:hypothetical protein